MKKHFIPMLVLCAFIMTMQSDNMLADHADQLIDSFLKAKI